MDKDEQLLHEAFQAQRERDKSRGPTFDAMWQRTQETARQHQAMRPRWLIPSLSMAAAFVLGVGLTFLWVAKDDDKRVANPGQFEELDAAFANLSRAIDTSEILYWEASTDFLLSSTIQGKDN